ncbi:UPF0187 domain membrane protein [Aspergillus clavatus NRRL 1]|uniref:UPF0187 domain membrane protein n=1 Tax=Aspergillus clavatus (strain ATCC 1007 / CBS 513.65 / DSM 816 / NCTC 3887 / NRRL 1 / QM 1276 / 107) TaxID=344612 RepID=A1CA07_ASPCL|nr:UPF0187 domain membrane protein [Aspergillus clavatus NRRL 1]EAW12575.1 UPF0187 domain membrane protein [Aspergillus clavatus NRRL 1]
MDGHAAAAPPAEAHAASTSTEPTLPVQANVHSQAAHHPQVAHHEEEKEPERVTPRPTFLENLADSRESQFMFHRRRSDDFDSYFHGPRDLDKHSKWPAFLRMHGSVLPKLILPLLIVAAWSTLITCISRFKHNLGINNILLTVLGFVVGLALSFRSSTAYERWADGRKYWALLIQTSRNLARTIWVNTAEREGELGKEDLLGKLTAMNLILAFAVALKHKLRFEPDVAYEDLAGLVGHLDTFAKEAHDREVLMPRKKTPWKSAGEYLGVSFAESNPRKLIKRSKKPLGHLPLEILNHLSAYIDSCIANGTLSVSLHQSQAIAALCSLNEVATGTERVLDTPLPVAYSIAIAQISWIYVLVLPFQLYNALEWVTIPGSIVAAYIILGLATIGSEIENPFGQDVNDLPLDTYCRQLAVELDFISATPPPKVGEFTVRDENLVLFPLSKKGYVDWKTRSVEDIRAALRQKVIANSSPRGTGLSNSSTLFDDGSVRSRTDTSLKTKQSV